MAKINEDALFFTQVLIGRAREALDKLEENVVEDNMNAAKSDAASVIAHCETVRSVFTSESKVRTDDEVYKRG